MLIELSEEERELVIRALDELVGESRGIDGLPSAGQGLNHEGRRAMIAHDLAERVRRLGVS